MDIQCLQLVLGVYKITDEDMENVVNTAIETGYRAFDTAYFYGNEVALGKSFTEFRSR